MPVEQIEKFAIVSRYFDTETMRHVVIETPFDGTYEQAGYAASREAVRLDGKFGASQWWSVNLFNFERRDSGSYFELFHGRTR